MTSVDYCSCNVCDKRYKIRYGASDQFPQEASFFCNNCGEKLIYGFDKERKLKLVNISKTGEHELADNVNLHPELLIDEDSKADPYYFATLDFMGKQVRSGDKDFTILRKMQKSVVAYNSGWSIVSKNFRFVKEKRFQLIDKKFGIKETNITKKIVKKVLEISKNFLQGVWVQHYYDAVSELESSRHIPSFNDFKCFLVNNVDEYIDSLFNIMTDYEKVKIEMLTTLVTQKCGHPISGMSSTVDWEKLEKVYGDLYERYGDLVLVLTGINNLNSRGSYEHFNTQDFTFQKYLNSDKANRCKNFEINPKLQVFSNFYEANIRNGTHHKNSKIDKETQEIVLGVGKGGNTEKRMAVAEYIAYCNELHARSLIMLNLIFKVIYS